MPRGARARSTQPADELVVAHPAAALRLHLVRHEAPVLEMRAPDRDAPLVQLAHAPMCGESARTRRTRSRQDPTGRARGRRRRSSPRTSRRPRPAARTAARRAEPRRASARPPRRSVRTRRPASSWPIGNASCAAIGPASSSATVRWIVTPVSSSPARIARSTGAAPRQRGSSDGWTFSHRRPLEQRAAGCRARTRTRRPSERRSPPAAPGAPVGRRECRAARQPPSPAAPRSCGRGRRAHPAASAATRHRARPRAARARRPRMAAVAATAIRMPLSAGRRGAAARRAPACGARRRCGR